MSWRVVVSGKSAALGTRGRRAGPCRRVGDGLRIASGVNGTKPEQCTETLRQQRGLVFLVVPGALVCCHQSEVLRVVCPPRGGLSGFPDCVFVRPKGSGTREDACGAGKSPAWDGLAGA